MFCPQGFISISPLINALFIFVCLLPSLVTAYDSLLGAPRPATCEHYVELLAPNRTTNQESIQNTSALLNFKYVDSSGECAKQLNSDWLGYRQCKENEVTLALYTETILPEGGYPYVRLNMSAIVLEPSSEIWFVYTCIQASDGRDTYCHHNGSTQIQRYGANVLPCRGVRLLNENGELGETKVPFRADVLCFKMFSFSQYQVDVILKPQQCRATIFATLPIETKFDPRINHFYSNSQDNMTALDYSEWSPFLFVETHPDDGVWVRFEYPPPLSRVLEVNFALYRQQLNGSSVQFVRDEIVRLPNTGFKWTDLDNGTYFVYAFVQRAHCRLVCSKDDEITDPLKDTKLQSPSCVTCPHTMLNFTITNPKFTPSWSRTQTLLTVIKVFAISILVLLLIVAFGLISVVGYLRYLRPRRHARRPPQNFELIAQPKVLILYTDDCNEHTECVLQLAHFLVANASAKVYVDAWDLINPSVRATNWLVNKLVSVDFVLLVFSSGSCRVMEGERMREQRPYPDLFNAALRLVVSKITSITSRSSVLDSQSSSNNQTRTNGHLPSNGNSTNPKELLKQFVVLRFNYTPKEAVAEFFPLMGCKSYQIPEDLPRLVGHLHKVETTDNSLLEFAADHEQLNDAVKAYKEFQAQNPNYLEERFTGNLPNQIGIDQLTGAELANPDLPEHTTRTDQEMLQLIEKYGLENGGHLDEERKANPIEPNQPQQNLHQSDHRLEEAYPLVNDDDSSTPSEDENG